MKDNTARRRCRRERIMRALAMRLCHLRWPATRGKNHLRPGSGRGQSVRAFQREVFPKDVSGGERFGRDSTGGARIRSGTDQKVIAFRRELRATAVTNPDTPKKSFVDFQLLTKARTKIFRSPAAVFAPQLTLTFSATHCGSTTFRQHYFANQLPLCMEGCIAHRDAADHCLPSVTRSAGGFFEISSLRG